VTQVLHDVFHIQAFRPWQLETINVALDQQDCILIMPTGGGKSLCYQLPALISSGTSSCNVQLNETAIDLFFILGITIVVSPLISLVEDQVYALRKLQVDARALNASTPREEQTAIMRILDGKQSENQSMKILYLTPGSLK
jgi:bloom syndrome protein